MRLIALAIILFFKNTVWASDCVISGWDYDRLITLKEIGDFEFAASIPKYLDHRIGSYLSLVYKPVDGVGDNKYQSLESKEYQNIIFSNFSVSPPEGYYTYVKARWGAPSVNTCAAQGIKRIILKSDLTNGSMQVGAKKRAKDS